MPVKSLFTYHSDGEIIEEIVGRSWLIFVKGLGMYSHLEVKKSKISLIVIPKTSSIPILKQYYQWGLSGRLVAVVLPGKSTVLSNVHVLRTT